MNLPATAESPVRPRSGRWVVLAMLGFGIVATTGIWGYWKLRLAPFLPLQKALLQEFPGSYPRIEGGRPKRGNPLLRIVMQVPSVPREDDPETARVCDRVVALAGEHLDLAAYSQFELYLVHYEPQKSPVRLKIARPLGSSPPGLPGGQGAGRAPP